MNTTHVVHALKSLFHLQKSQSSQISNGEVLSNQDFRNLCNVLKSQIRHLELSDLIETVKCLGYLGVSSDSKVMNVTLGLISKQVNDLSLQQITFLDFVMADFKQTPLVKALKIALPIVFEASLQTRCNFDNISLMTDLLFFVYKRKHLGKSYDILLDALIEKRHQFTLKDAKSIVLCITESKHYNDNNHLLLHHSLDHISDSIRKIDFYELENILYKLCKRFVESNNDTCYYHEEFCNACAEMVIENNYGFEQTTWILKKLIKFNHCHLPLLQHMSVKVEKEPWLLEQNGAAGLIFFLSGFSVADYKPSNWDRIKPLVVKACQGLMDRSELPWLKVVLDLCIMDVWAEEFIEKVFSREFLNSFMVRDYNKLDGFQLLSLDQVSATLSPWPIKPRAPADIVAPIVQQIGTHLTNFCLHLPLQHGLGGPEYVHTGVLSPLGHFLDHVVVMRKGGYPVAINMESAEKKERVKTEDILVPPDAKLIAVLYVPTSMCATNSERVRGLFRIQVNTIEALGIPVCTILQPLWKSLPDFERIPYLMRAIREKLPSDEKTTVISPF
ncbi:uncharacterized protein LOC128983277 isoform X2 [Macrosteles quadrilineatus]|nr:uncharacterized protein LOC128983277 isoform X2 [Macrosteles quadrilineatus]